MQSKSKMSSNMILEGNFDALIRQNEMLIKKICEDAQRESETKAKNEYLQKQLPAFLK